MTTKNTMRDFTLAVYKNLLTKLIKANYRFVTFAEFVKTKPKAEKLIILRHDVDRLPKQALQMAKIEQQMGVKASYYFRYRQNDFAKNIIRDIAALNHEIGYHYETLNICNGNIENAFNEFKKNLESLRKLVPVVTICRHGSPRSKWDNAEIWKDHDYKQLGIIGEPYFDIDFNEVLYLTDTGRRWDGDKVSIRDKVIGNGQHKLSAKRNAGGSNLSVSRSTREVVSDGEDRGQKEKECRGAVCSPGGTDQSDPPTYADDWCCDPPVFNPHSTGDIITALKNNRLPDKIMLTIHPQRWTDNCFLWIEELIWQKIKNPLKYLKLKRMEKISKKVNGK